MDNYEEYLLMPSKRFTRLKRLRIALDIEPANRSFNDRKAAASGGSKANERRRSAALLDDGANGETGGTA
ncbi:hypothetical protein [Sphingobium olei]|uniref:hypothetical protein n=1 Tax=Sphingobium olei TaxID=420955 RepID=UPI003D1A3D83